MAANPCRSMRALAAAVVCVAAVLVATVASAGGSDYRAKVREFVREGKLAAKFTVVLVTEGESFPGGCKSLEVQARYAWWKWWWDDVAGQVNRTAQQQALDALERSA